MRLGVLFPSFRHWADGAAVRELVGWARACGVESLWLPDRLTFPKGAGERGNAQPLGQWMAGAESPSSTDGSHAADHGVGDAFREPFTMAAFIAGIEPSMTIGTSVALLPLRNPFVTARSVATLDRLTDGRFLFGVGAGHVPAEYDVLGLDYRRRHAVFAEWLEAVTRLWTEDVASFAGEFVSFQRQRMMLKVRTKPHPPVVIGGHGKRALRLGARKAQGWVASHLSPEALGRGIDYLREQGCDVDDARFEVSVLVKMRLLEEPAGTAGGMSESGRLLLDLDRWAELLDRYAAVGCDRIIAQLPTPNIEVMKRQVALLTQGRAAPTTGERAAPTTQEAAAEAKPL